jgi:hypothetical protein
MDVCVEEVTVVIISAMPGDQTTCKCALYPSPKQKDQQP